MIVKKTQNKIAGIILLLLLPFMLSAQKKGKIPEDTLAVYREFIEACISSKAAPLQLQMELQNSTNFITGEQDTAKMRGEFFIGDKSAYVRFGEVEQFVTDSLALLVSNRMHRMMLFADAGRVAAGLKAAMGIVVKDASAVELSKKYTAVRSEAKDAVVILLVGRILIPTTSIPRETIELKYEKSTSNIKEVSTVKRILIPVSEEDYSAMISNNDFALKLVTIEGEKHFLLKEQTGTFVYHSIRHEPNVMPPATITERIKKDKQGEYATVQGYEGYAITVN